MSTKINKSSSPSVEGESTYRLDSMSNRQSRVEILQTVASMTGLKRIDVEAVFDATLAVISGHLKPGGSGEVIVPKLGIKIKRVRRNATKDRTMVSPLTNEEVFIPGKPERDGIKLLDLKPLREALAGDIEE